MTISYVNPSWPVGLRREVLEREYGFECNCTRCVEEMAFLKKGGENGIPKEGNG